MGIAIKGHLKKRSAVEHNSGRIPAFFVARCGWNRDDEGNSRPILMIESGNTGSVVTHPDGPVRGDGHAPGVDQISIDVCSDPSDVGLKIGPAIGVGTRRNNAQ